MGKEWLFWGGGKSTKKLGKTGGGAEREAAAEVAAPTGCMCAVLQLFDLHQFQFALHHQPSFRQAAGSFLHDEPCISIKGLEAPRNSLEVDEPLMESDSTSSSTRRKEQQNLDIPAVSIQIKTTRENKSPRTSFSKATRSSSSSTADDLFSDSCNSNSPAGGNKTPTLVARLMGLDQLPPQPQLQNSTNSPPAAALNSQIVRRDDSGLILNDQNRSCSHRSFFDNDITAGSSTGTGTLSLPETPRISSARRSDVDHGHRLSLQIHKENVGEELFYSSAAAAAAAKNLARKRRQLTNKEAADRDDEEPRRSGSEYARELVKQVKESVSRKVGLDITNTIKSRDHKIRSSRTDDHIVLLKPNKQSSKVVNNVTSKVGHEPSLAGPTRTSKQSTSSCSPRLLDPIINKSHSPRVLLSPWSPASQENQQAKVHSTSPKPQLLKLREEQQSSAAVVPLKKCKKDGNDKYTTSRVRRSASQVLDPILKKKEEPFIRPTSAHKGNNIVTDKKSKKTPISNDIFNISVPTLLPVLKKQSQAASSSDGEVGKRSTQILSSCSSQTYKQQQVTHTLNFQENNQDRCYRTTTRTRISSGDGVELEYGYYNYIQRILKRAGIDKATPVLSLAKWYSRSHPLDPSIFHYMELFHPSASASGAEVSELQLRSNRKLVFQLVDELLADILRPHLEVSGTSCCWPRDQILLYGSELLDTLCSKINNFPRADCKVLEDIDALIGTDLGKSSSSSWVHANYDDEEEEEEGEGIVEEIQREIVKSLVHDTAMAILTSTTTVAALQSTRTYDIGWIG